MKAEVLTFGHRDFVEFAKLARVLEGIFGPGVVKTAWVEEDGLANLKRSLKAWPRKESEVNLDAMHIIVDFQNGRRLVFWNSEWGGIQREQDWKASDNVE